MEWKKIDYLEKVGLEPWYHDQPRLIAGFILKNGPTVIIPGAYMMAAYVGVVLLYLCSCWLSRWWYSRGRMSEVSGGKFRLAASTGRVDLMAGMKPFVEGFDIESSVLGFTALHASCCQNQLGAVLWLCQNGANLNAVKLD